MLLNDEACRSSAFELKPCVAVAAPDCGNISPPAVSKPVKIPLAAERPEVKVALVPVSDPMSAPPVSCR